LRKGDFVVLSQEDAEVVAPVRRGIRVEHRDPHRREVLAEPGTCVPSWPTRRVSVLPLEPDGTKAIQPLSLGAPSVASFTPTPRASRMASAGDLHAARMVSGRQRHLELVLGVALVVAGQALP